jgi:Ca-activated chloride channel family protein
MKNMLMKGLLCTVLGSALISYGAGLIKPLGTVDVAGAYIKSHDVHVVINNGFAQTIVDQVFGNDAELDYEAIYSFPLPKKASLSEISLWINGREVIGEVIERERARKIYDEQVKKGNDTALAEKNDFKTFDIHIGRVRAGQDTRVRMVYYQPMEVDLNIGRYVYPLQEGGVDEERIAFWETDETVHDRMSFNLTLKSAFPVADVRVPGYDQEALISQTNNTYQVSLHQEEGASTLSRDIVFYYRLDDSTPARVEIIPYRASNRDDGTFMAVITPAADLKRIEEGTDWIFVLDTSGSMSGDKISMLANGVEKVLGKMSPNDRFKLITFNNSATDLTGSFIQATPQNVQTWINNVHSIKAGGGTALFAGLKKAYNSLDDDRTTGVILVTDGVCNAGPRQHKAFLNLLKQYDIRLFTFIMGNSANEPLMQRLARDSGGFAMNISNSDDIVGRLLQAKIKVLHQCMHDVKLKFNGERVYDLTPSKIGNLFMGQQLIAFGRYHGPGEVNLTLEAKISGEQKQWHCKAQLPEIDTEHPELERLWALAHVEEAMEVIREDGETPKLREKIVDLGTTYSLVTDYTSMIVLNDEELENEGIQRNNYDRVQRERAAQQQRANQPTRNHRVDQGGTFNNRRSHGIGTGPVGPLFIALATWLNRKRKITENK